VQLNLKLIITAERAERTEKEKIEDFLATKMHQRHKKAKDITPPSFPHVPPAVLPPGIHLWEG